MVAAVNHKRDGDILGARQWPRIHGQSCLISPWRESSREQRRFE